MDLIYHTKNTNPFIFNKYAKSAIPFLMAICRLLFTLNV